MAAVGNPFVLPTHPTMRHPHTGEPLRAVGFRRSGAPIWPILGASPNDAGASGGAGAGAAASGSGGAAGSGAGAGAAGGTGGSGGTGAGAGADQDTAGATGNATDGSGNDLGFPKDTPVAQMTEAQAAAYWRNQSKIQQSKLERLVGDRSPEEIRADLDAYAQIQREQQTPAEQALNDAREDGRKAGIQAERRTAATAIFRTALEGAGITGDDLDEIANNFAIDNYIGENGIDTTRITAFARRFGQSGSDNQQRHQRRDFGGGSRGDGQNGQRTSGGKSEAQRRFATNKSDAGS